MTMPWLSQPITGSGSRSGSSIATSMPRVRTASFSANRRGSRRVMTALSGLAGRESPPAGASGVSEKASAVSRR